MARREHTAIGTHAEDHMCPIVDTYSVLRSLDSMLGYESALMHLMSCMRQTNGHTSRA